MKKYASDTEYGSDTDYPLVLKRRFPSTEALLRLTEHELATHGGDGWAVRNLTGTAVVCCHVDCDFRWPPEPELAEAP